MNNEQQQTQTTDDPSGEGWRDVEPDEILQAGDMFPNGGQWERTGNPGLRAREGRGGTYRRRIEQQPEAQPEPQSEPQPNADDPSGPGWRDVGPDELLQTGDMYPIRDHWEPTASVGAKARVCGNGYRRRIEQPQPSDSEPETVHDLRRRLDAAVRQNVELADELANEQNKKGAYKAILKRTMERAREAEALVAEAERSGQQVNAELQQLREQVATLTRELKAERDGMIGNLRSQNRLGQEAAVELIEAWLRPVVELMAEQPEDHAELAIVILAYLPQIASRLIEE